MSGKPYIVYVHESNPKGKDRLFKYPLDSGKDFDYRARVSSNYFFMGNHRNWKDGACPKGYPKPGSIIYSFHHDFDPHIEYLIKKDTPVIEVGSIWEFYKAIGYDYKKQKWL
jgi:hypothetical protein